MNDKYLYLTINIASFIVPFMFSFYPKANFSKKWKFVLPAILITASIFVAWDEWFTRLGVWGFNPRYTTGLSVLSLPIEEILFFICIPYACTFTYFALNHLIKKDYLLNYHEQISNLLIFTLLALGIFYINLRYTSLTFLAIALLLFYVTVELKPIYMSRFYLSFIFLLLPFFIVNGILTGSFVDEPIVWYNDHENLNIRVGTIPVEDIFYGMLMILSSTMIAEELEARFQN